VGLASFATLACMTCAAAQPSYTETLEPGPAYQAAHGAAASALVARIEALARDHDSSGLVQLADEVLADATLAPAARERVLYETAMALAELDSSPDTQALLDMLRRRDVEAQVWRYDDAHRTAVPLYEVAAAARYAERRRDERKSSASALEAIAQGSDAPVVMFDAVPDARDEPARSGILRAFETAPTAELLAYRDRLTLEVERGARIEIAQIVARRLGDATLMQAVLARADATLALEIVRTARASFTESQALDLLQQAAAREDVGSAALLAAGPIVTADPRARTWLFDTLKDARGAGSAAAALASQHDPEVAASLRAWVLEQDTITLARRGILALRLDASESARAELAKIASDPALAAELRAEALR
jgi:hypothetical protein